MTKSRSTVAAGVALHSLWLSAVERPLSHALERFHLTTPAQPVAASVGSPHPPTLSRPLPPFDPLAEIDGY